MRGLRELATKGTTFGATVAAANREDWSRRLEFHGGVLKYIDKVKTVSPI